MDFCKDLGAKLQRLRKRKGYLVWEVAHCCGVNPKDIGDVERGEVLPNYALFQDICSTLGTSTSEVMKAYRWVYTPPKAVP